VLEPADVIRPSDQPKDHVYYTASHRGETTAITLAFSEPPPLTFAMGRVTDGMAQNAALAICAALWLGISPKAIQDKLTDWHPASLRGEWRKVDGRLLYLDCYNANPASMADALATFCSVAPEDMPRLFLIGCMEELGAEAERYHRELGQTIRLRPEDRLIVIGAHAEAVRAGLLEKGASHARIETTQTTSRMAEALVDFRGAVFVKGSRRYQLEGAFSNLVPVETAHA
jgi:UDP-N-acetylmuramoyl-tripeptide--D-alanyl-D-alanine ligase